MTRPVDFTDAERIAADERRASQLSRGVLPPACAEEGFREIWYAFCWMKKRMAEAGADVTVLTKAGNLMTDAATYGGKDPWEAATGLLETWVNAKKEWKQEVERN